MQAAALLCWRLRLSAVSCFLVLWPLNSAWAQTSVLPQSTRDRIAADCRRQHPSLILEYLSRRACIEENERVELARIQQERQAEVRRLSERRASEERRRREEAARPCIATALPIMEEALQRIRDSVNFYMDIDQVKNILDTLFMTPGEIVFSHQDIFQRVYVNYIRPPCSTDFHFLINVNANRDGQLLRLGVWVQNPPAGYAGDFRPDFSRNLAQERADEQERQRNALLAERELRRQADLQRRADAARSQLAITGRNIECPSITSCSGYIVTVYVQNRSVEIVRGIRFGFILIPEGGDCPANLTPRVSRQFTLQPGETGTFLWTGFEPGMPPPPSRNRPLRYCVSIVGVDLG